MHRTLFGTKVTATQLEPEAVGKGLNRGLTSGLAGAGKLVYSLALVATLTFVAFAFRATTANAKEPELPYVTIDHPQFIAASEANFLHANDLLIGVSNGKTVKAYPAAILAQHGVVQDQMPDGPIAVTW